MTKLTLENENGEYSIAIKEEEINLYNVFQHLIIPILLSAGYSADSINEQLSE